MTRRPADAPYVVWLDLETTGNRDTDKIIEIGAAITDRDLNIVDTFSQPVYPYPDVRKGKEAHRESVIFKNIREAADPVVRDMHDKSGLWNAVVDQGVALPTADLALTRFVEQYADGTNHLPLAGSGVSHFDRRYIRAQLPMSERRFAYWHYDIGVMRRFLAWWGIESPSALETKAGITHRALDDVRAHIAEAQVWRRVLTTAWDFYSASQSQGTEFIPALDILEADAADTDRPTMWRYGVQHTLSVIRNALARREVDDASA